MYVSKYGSPERIFVGDQADPQHWERFRREVGRALTILIDATTHDSLDSGTTIQPVVPS